MTARVFVDTNVLVYARDASEPAKQQLASAWLERLWRERSGRISVQVLSEYFVTITQKLKPGLPAQAAWEDVTLLLTWQPCPIDANILKRGRELQQRHRLSWWDSLIIAAAERQDCALLLSDDLQDGGVYGNVEVRSPFSSKAGEPTKRYAAATATARRHPLRGRPKRST
jgi:predicted nucleic acid-binding protein